MDNEGSNHSKSEVHMLLGSIFSERLHFIRYMQSCMPSSLVYFPLPASRSVFSVCVVRSLFPFST